jgi:glutamate---cysteine ligase / carboxylate-amine ligase
VSFGSSTPGSLGVEEELYLVDAESLEPVPLAAVVVPDPGPRIKHELFASVVEITTPVCVDAGQVFDELRRLRAEVASRAAEHGATILAAGTHPTALGVEQPVTDEPLYRTIAKELGPALSRQFVCGLHVHVSVTDEETCLRALEGVLPWLPDLLALSANSPFLEGADSGVRSARAEALAALPNAGAPPIFRTWADWEARTAGVDYRRLHWDIRPHPDYGTLEVRIADQQTDVRRSAALAGLIQQAVLSAASADAGSYDRDLYAERRAQAAAVPSTSTLLESPPEADRQLEIGLSGVVRDLAGRSLA